MNFPMKRSTFMAEVWWHWAPWSPLLLPTWRRCLSLVQQAQDTVAVRKRCGLGDGIISDWWFGTWLLFSIMGCHPSHWRTHIFQDGYCTTNQIWDIWWKHWYIMVYLLFDMGNEIEFERTYLFDVIDTIVYYNFVDRTPNQYKLIINHHQLYHCILIFLWLEPIVWVCLNFSVPQKIHWWITGFLIQMAFVRWNKSHFQTN